jgi:hypothetical protein
MDNPGSPYANKDRSSFADTGGLATGKDCRRVRVDASELKPLDAPWVKGLDADEAVWASAVVNPESSAYN